MLLRAQSPASINLVPNGAVFKSSTNDVAAPCSTRDTTLAGVPFANEPATKFIILTYYIYASLEKLLIIKIQIILIQSTTSLLLYFSQIIFK